MTRTMPAAFAALVTTQRFPEIEGALRLAAVLAHFERRTFTVWYLKSDDRFTVMVDGSTPPTLHAAVQLARLVPDDPVAVH